MSASGRLAGAVAALALGVAACGGDDDERRSLTTPGGGDERATPAPDPDERAAEPAGKVDPADERIVRRWADTLRRGDVRGAARYFALPSLVSNGTAPIRIRTRAAARFFNRTLPCGAVLVETDAAAHGFLIATFRLTERPGRGACGAGTGATARTAFRVRDDRITDWLRVPDGAPEPDDVQA